MFRRLMNLLVSQSWCDADVGAVVVHADTVAITLASDLFDLTVVRQLN